MADHTQYRPDRVSAPGETLLEILKERGMSQAELCRRTGHEAKTINTIIKGKAPITPRTALELERVLGIPADFWNRRESKYREYKERVDETRRLQGRKRWLQRFPFQNMVKLGWIKPQNSIDNRIRELLCFFGVASPDQWEQYYQSLSVSFRTSWDKKNDKLPTALMAWLRRGEIEAARVSCKPYDPASFKKTLHEIRKFTLQTPEEWQPKLEEACRECGVAVVFVPGLPGMKTWGATRWVSSNKALIQLSLRYKSNDHLWFTFFHEAGHILLHGKRKFFLEGEDSSGCENNEEERQADTFAANFLIPPLSYEIFLQGGRPTRKRVVAFAESLRIAPGIVVGRLQHDGKLPRSHLNDLKQRLTWAH